jgi:hypothetical protein
MLEVFEEVGVGRYAGPIGGEAEETEEHEERKAPEEAKEAKGGQYEGDARMALVEVAGSGPE